MFEGSIVALVTPFKKSEEVDYQSLRRLVEFHREAGTDAILPCGCTGEAATLTHEEHLKVIETVIEASQGRVKVVAGTGSNSTHEAIYLTRHAKELGADAALLITPYYNKPTPQGLYLHYKKVAQEVDIPIILYNVPSRTGISLLPETVARLFEEEENIVAIKEASGSLEQVNQILHLCEITVLSGDDSLTLPMLAVGARGVVSVAANVMPKEVKELVWSFLRGDLEESRRVHFRLFPLFKALFFETNPIPVKYTLSLLGMIDGELRQPLTPLSQPHQERLKEVLRDLGLLKEGVER